MDCSTEPLRFITKRMQLFRTHGERVVWVCLSEARMRSLMTVANETDNVLFTVLGSPVWHSLDGKRLLWKKLVEKGQNNGG